MSGTARDLPARHRLTIGDYQRLGEVGILPADSRVELIDGALIDMAPIGSLHAGTVLHLSNLLSIGVGSAAFVWVQNPIVLDQHSEPEPDIVLLQPREDFYKLSLPRPDDILLIIEVADTSLQYDRQIKIRLYASHGIPEVWLVDLVGKALTVFRSPSELAYQEIIATPSLGRLSPKRLSTLTLDLSSLF